MTHANHAENSVQPLHVKKCLKGANQRQEPGCSPGMAEADGMMAITHREAQPLGGRRECCEGWRDRFAPVLQIGRALVTNLQKTP